MENDPDLEFEHYLASQLGMTVTRMRAEMSGQEYMNWGAFYSRKAQRAELERLKAGG